MATKELQSKKVSKRTINVEPPTEYKIVYLNDDVTTVDFVVFTLTDIFLYSEQEALDLASKIHHEGNAVIAVYPYEIAEQKGSEVILLARRHNFPLKVNVEPV
jgi:ATP-dependent Clp protease adaptor protein ClpS